MENEENGENSEILKFQYGILTSLRTSGTRDYHSLNSAYLTGNSILVTALTILVKFGEVIQNPLIFIISVMGLFLCFQMWLAQCRFRAINTSFAERLRTLENDNDWLPPIFNDVYNIEENEQLSVELEKDYYHTRGVRWGRSFWGGRMKLLPFIFSILFLSFILFSYWENILIFLDP